MRILFFSPCPLDPRLGAARALMELAAHLAPLDCDCTLMAPPDLGVTQRECSPKLRAYLARHAREFDVVDFDYKCLSLGRGDFGARTLMVARAQLLRRHHLLSALPPVRSVRSAARLARFRLHRWKERRRLTRDDRTFRAADLVTVLNRPAKEALTRQGVDPDRILVFPNGLSPAHRASLEKTPIDPPREARVVFVGDFGLRKGELDIPHILREIRNGVPDARFRLLGTGASAAEVLRRVPASLRARTEVVPRFEPDTLGTWLADCAIGIFPSYAEGFPLAVLEMLAAGVPVVAYDAPGAPELLSPESLVPPGDTRAMSRAVVRMLRDRELLAESRRRARRRSSEFTWDDVAARTARAYRDALRRKAS